MTTEEAIDRDIRDALARGMTDGPLLEDDPVAAVRRRLSTRRARRHRGAVLAGVGVVVALALATSAMVDDDSESEDVRAADRSTTTADPPSTSSTPSTSPSGGVLPSPPLDVRGDAAVVWSGREVVVWGGDVEAGNMGLPGPDRNYVDGAAFDPSTGRWRTMSTSPLPASPATTVGVKVHDGIVFVRGRDTALWDPDTDTWRSLDDAPTPVSDLSSTGRGAISYTGRALLDPVAGTWVTLPAPPLQLERPTSVWDGTELVVIGGPSTPFTDAAAIAYDPERERWRTLPDPPRGLGAAALSADWDGERVIVVNYDMQAAAYDPADEVWAPLPEIPARFSEWYPTLRSAGRFSVAFMAHALVILVGGDAWVPLPGANVAYGSAVGADGGSGPDVIYAFGLDPDRPRNVLSSILPGAASESPDRIQIGLYTADLPDAASVVTATYSSGVPAPGEHVRVAVRTATGTCVLVGGAGTEPIPEPVSEPLNGLSWTRDEVGSAWRLRTSTTDALRIDCDDTDSARALAASVPAPVR